MFHYTPFTSQAYVYPQDAFSESGFYEFLVAQGRATAHARVHAIHRQRHEDEALAYHLRQTQAAFSDILPRVHPRQASYRRRAPSRTGPSMYFSSEDLALDVWREQERRRNLLARQHEAQRQRALLEAAARQEAEMRARARVLQAQQMQEQQRQEAARRARAREAQRAQERDAFLAFLDLVSEVATQIQTQQVGNSCFCVRNIPLLTSCTFP